MSDTQTLTLLFTDIEGSTALWEANPDGMEDAVTGHLAQLRTVIERHDGTVVKLTGDGVFASFASARSAAQAAVEAQRQTTRAVWSIGTLKVRMGLHTGECSQHGGDLYGRAVNKAARIEQAAWGTQVLLSAATAELIREELDESLSLAYLGEHHFDGILDAERVYELSVADIEVDHPPLRARDIGLEQLPPELTALIGRAAEVEAIQQELRANRLVTVVGPPGVGKSRLALRVATDASRERSSGVRLIDLAPCRRAASAEGLIANGVGVRLGDESSYVDAVVRALRATDTLVVLDNCEHVLEPVASMITTLLQACPAISFLVASRERIGLPIEVVMTLAPLPLPDATASTLPALSRAPSAQVLLERLSATGVAGDLTDDDAAVLAEVCRRCDGLPLALELAAASLESMSPEELLSSLDSSIGVLGQPRGGTSWGRHAGLRDALDASYLALSDAEQHLLDEMAAFAGFVPAPTISEVCRLDPATTRELVDGLARRSLVVSERRHGTRCYRLLESIRQYAMEHGRVDASLRRRHADHFVELSERVCAAYRTSEARAAARTVEDHFDDLRLALNRLVEQDRLSDATRLVVGLHEPCMFALRIEHHRWAQHLFDAVDPSSVEAARLGGVLAMGHWFRGDHRQALAVGQQALDAAAKATEPVLTIWVHQAMMNAAGFTGDYDAVFAHCVAVIKESRDERTPYWELNARATEGVALAVAGSHEQAFGFATKAVAIAEELGHPEGLAWSYFSLAMAVRPNDLDAAEVALDRALSAARSNGGRWNEGIMLMEQLSVKAERGDLSGVTTALDVLAHLDRAGGHAQMWEAVLLSSSLLVHAGRAAEAAVLLAAIADRPRQPRSESVPLDEILTRRLEAELLETELARARAEGRYLTPPEILQRCRDELEALLQSWAESGLGPREGNEAR